MYNMSYCRWQNTAGALQECIDNLDESLNSDVEPANFDSVEEYEKFLENKKDDPLSVMNFSDDERSAFARVVGQMQTLSNLLSSHGIDENDISQFNVY